jgi:hypothetical protein
VVVDVVVVVVDDVDRVVVVVVVRYTSQHSSHVQDRLLHKRGWSAKQVLNPFPEQSGLASQQ